MQSHPPTPASPKPTQATSQPHQPNFNDTPAPAAPTPAESGRRRVAPSSKPAPSEFTHQPQQEAAPEAQGSPARPRTPSVEEVENNPLVKTVLDVFDGEIKRVHPKNP